MSNAVESEPVDIEDFSEAYQQAWRNLAASETLEEKIERTVVQYQHAWEHLADLHPSSSAAPSVSHRNERDANHLTQISSDEDEDGEEDHTEAEIQEHRHAQYFLSPTQAHLDIPDLVEPTDVVEVEYGAWDSWNVHPDNDTLIAQQQAESEEDMDPRSPPPDAVQDGVFSAARPPNPRASPSAHLSSRPPPPVLIVLP